MNPMIQRLFHTVRDGIFIVGRDGIVRFGNEAAQCLIPSRVGETMSNPALLRMITTVNGGHAALPYAADIELGAECLVAAADTIRAHILQSPVGTDYVVVLHNLTDENFYASAIENLVGMVDRECGASLIRFKLGLTSLLGRLDGIGEGRPELVDQARGLMNEGRGLLETLRRLSDLARISGGESIVGDDRIAVLDWVAGCVEAMRPAANRRGMALSIEQPADEMPPIYGSRMWLERAFSELLDNAVKFGPARSNVLVTFRQNGNFMQLSVRNVGDQIPAHLRHRLFQALYRGRNAQQSNTQGLGLGLNLARQIVRMHGGNVTAGSCDEGETDFTLELPTGAPSRENPDVGIAQVQRYAQDLARLMKKRRSRTSQGVEE